MIEQNLTRICLALAFAVSGCAGTLGVQQPREKAFCGDGAKERDVTIAVQSLSGETLTVQIDPEHQAVGRKGGQVTWKLFPKVEPGSRNGYRFANPGITFKPGSDPGPNESRFNGADFVVCFDATEGSRTWRYTARIEGSLSGKPVAWKCDPTIVNDDMLVAKKPGRVVCPLE
jgi:hypothetical protein